MVLVLEFYGESRYRGVTLDHRELPVFIGGFASFQGVQTSPQLGLANHAHLR